MRRIINNQILSLREVRKNIKNLIEEPKFKSNDTDNAVCNIPSFQTDKKSLKELKVAAVMDRFTLECFSPECNLLELTPDNWLTEIESFSPDLVFIESAWEGKDKLWSNKINRCADEFVALMEYSHSKNIPVVFWNKEDPVHTTSFIKTAGFADFVFTTDIECIEKYKTALNHDRVYHLHFGAQPKTHNPIEKYDRKDKFCFAGAYYHRYEDRCRVFDSFAEYFIENRGFDIYDRNFNHPRPEFAFPKSYNPYILGTLDPSEIDIAYKGYVYGVNMNSVTQSETMFARRVFELIASNTVVVGNYSRGVKNYFGDLTFCTDDVKTLKANFDQYCADSNSADKYRLLSLRKVLSEHLMADRLDYIVEKVFGKSLKTKLPTITVYSYVANKKEADRIIELFNSQSHKEKKLILISDAKFDVSFETAVISNETFENTKVSKLIEENAYLACFDVKDWYGENYLLDLALSTRYGNFEAIGKAEYFKMDGTKAERVQNNKAYHLVEDLENRRCMVSTKLLNGLTGADLTAKHTWSGNGFMSIDAMNYCENFAQKDCSAAEDLFVLDKGASLETIEEISKKIEIHKTEEKTLNITVKELQQLKFESKLPIKRTFKKEEIFIESNLKNGKRTYLTLEKMFDIQFDLNSENEKLWILFKGESTTALYGYCIFYDEDGNKLDSQSFRVGFVGQIVPPENTVYIKIAYRISGKGEASLKGVELGSGVVSLPKGGCYIPSSNVLVVTPHYPAYDDLYRNMFVHKRLTEYKKDNKLVDVMRITSNSVVREFEGINVIEGQINLLDMVLNNKSFDTVCVHFMSPDMWDVLKKYSDSTRILIWVHGAEIQPWWRRKFNCKNDEELKAAKVLSKKRESLWNEIFEASKTNQNIHFIFVSQYFADEVFSDYNVTLSDEQYSIVHNCIDTNQFNYIPKQADDRKKLLSIRPYVSPTYANDLTVKALLKLSKQSWFKELDIMICGSGPLYKETLVPLKKFKNVHMKEAFLTQNEIAQIHKNYGIFLIPTRMDTQGVSRDEAMSSGLVPVTNAVAAIPEFVDESCGILADGEDYMAMAEGIKKLYHNPELFLQMSENAAKRVRSQTSREYTIEKELELIFPEVSNEEIMSD